MDISPQIEAVYRRALLLKERASESPVQQILLEQALKELYNVLEELQSSEEELRHQNQVLISTRHSVETERQRYQDLFNLAPDGYLVTDANGKILEANLAIASMLNVSQQFLVGKPLPIFIAEQLRLDFYLQLNRLQQIQKLQDWELLLSPRHGVTFDAAITVTAFRNPENDELNMRWLIRDITVRKRIKLLLENLNAELESQVQERTFQLQQALEFEAGLKRITDKVRDSLDENDILQAVVQELTLVLGIICCNTASYNLELATSTVRCYYTTSENETNNLLPLFQGEIVPMTVFSQRYDQLLQNQYLQFCEIDATYSQFAILAYPIADDQGVLGDLCLFKPSTEAFNELEIRLVQQVANQCAIAIRQARLYHAAQQQVEELESLNRLKDDFLNTVSHELRTPIATIRMSIQMLEIILAQPETLRAKPETATRYLEILRHECQREMSLINDLLDSSRLDANTEPLLLTTVDLSLWILHVIEPFEELFSSQQQQLEIHIPNQLPTLTTDLTYLEHILTELLNNAYKYTPPQETIALSACATTEALLLSISNSGVEIPAKELGHIFDKFYRVPSNDPWKHSGTGLGLALLKKRVEQIQSKIEVASQRKWLTFTLHIPWSIEVGSRG